ncbi:DUF3999 domain-containing protein [Proteobacteria bacterium 005FR1]|nr:DUF3999 domain-containing protein [Proteobacteria bacterium 005FR1]
MKNMFFGALASLCVALPSAAQTPVFETTENRAVYLQAPLAHVIYRYARDSQLHDLVVLDANGNELPSRVIDAPAVKSENAELVSLSFFAVPAGTKPQSWFSDGKARVEIDGGTVSVTVDELDSKAAREGTAFYLVDLRNLEVTIDGISLDWPTAEPGQYLQVSVEGSDDLQHWQNLALETLVQLSREGEMLLHREIPLSLRPDQFDYLRIRFPKGESPELSGISALRAPVVEYLPLDRWQVEGKLAEAQSSVVERAMTAERDPVAAWHYQREENAPARAVSIDLGEIPYGDRLRIYSRDDDSFEWRLLHSGIWFNARVGDEWQRSEAISTYPNTDRFWRVELAQAIAAKTKPVLVFEQPRQLLQFIANNNPPYRIAVADTVRSGKAAGQVLSQLIGDDSVEWQSVDLSLIEGVRPPAAKAAGLNWSAWLFWALLVLAVLVLIAFAVRLYRQMK